MLNAPAFLPLIYYLHQRYGFKRRDFLNLSSYLNSNAYLDSIFSCLFPGNEGITYPMERTRIAKVYLSRLYKETYEAVL